MTIFPVYRYKFLLSDKEIEALELIGNIDCSQSLNCIGCPFSLLDNDNTEHVCLKGLIHDVLDKKGVLKDE